MVASSRDSINQRVTLTGDDDVRRQLEQIAATGDKAFSNVGRSSGQLRGSLQNLGFQVNDLVTSFASGAPVMQVFAQQGGQIVQAFQQGGGLGPVLGGVARGLKSILTPGKAAIAVVVAAGAELGILATRASDAETSVRHFDAVLKGLGKTGLPQELRGGDKNNTTISNRVSGADLEKQAEQLRDAGLTYTEARQQMLDAIRTGVDPGLAQKVVKIGQDLNAVLGDKAAGEWFKAVGGGAGTLREFAEKMGLVKRNTSGASDGLNTLDALIGKIGERVKGADENSLSPFARVVRKLATSWDDLQRAMASGDVTKALAPLEKIGETLFDANKDAFSKLFEPLSGFAKTALDDIKAQFVGAWDNYWSGFTQSAGDALKALFKKINDGFNEVHPDITGLQQAFNEFFNWQKDAFSHSWDGYVAAFNAATSGITDAGTALSEKLREIFGGDTIWDAFRNAGFAAFNALSSALDSLIGKAQSLADAISSAVGAGAGSNFGPGGFAAGTMSTPPGTILVGERGPELISQPGGLRVWPNGETQRILSAFNSLNTSLLPPSRRFAAGTIGATAGDVAAAHFHFGDGTTGTMRGRPSVLEALAKEARAKNMLSAGRRQSAIGGRRYGG